MKARRRALAADAKAAADAVVCEKLKARKDIGVMVDPFECDGALAVYLASPDEIDIDPYIAYMLHAGYTVVAPRWNGETYELAKLKDLDGKNLRWGPMGIREPVDADIVEPEKVAAWIVPGLAFTRGGGRLGYGGGWYDRLLASASKYAVKIGVAYSFQIVDDLPAEPHDIPLTDVIDDSLDDDALDFKETDDGFSAKVSIKDRRQRVKPIAIGLLWTLLSPAIGFAVFCVLFALARSGVFVPSRRVVFIVLLCVLAGFVFSVAVLIKAIAASVECAAEIHFARGEGVCRRKLFGRLPLPVRRFALSPWSEATGGSCSSNMADSNFDTVKIWPDGWRYSSSALPLTRTYARTAFMLAFQINRANKWDDEAYAAARRARLSNLPRGMRIHPTDDGRGRVAVIRPFSLHGILYVVLIAQVAALISVLAFFIPYIGWALGLLVAVVASAGCLFWVLRELLGFARLEVRDGQIHCIDGLWPFTRKCDVSLEGVVPSANGDFGWWDDLFECRDPFSWLPPKYMLPLRLFLEEEIAKCNNA